MKEASRFLRPLVRIAILGNVIYILWLVRNAIDSGFKINVEAVAVMGLLFLLILNITLLYLMSSEAKS